MTNQKSKIYCLVLVSSILLASNLAVNADNQSLTVVNKTDNYDVSIKKIYVVKGFWPSARDAYGQDNPGDLQDIAPKKTAKHTFGAEWLSFDTTGAFNQHLPLKATVVFKDRRTGKETEPKAIGPIKQSDSSTTPTPIIDNISMSYSKHQTDNTRGYDWNSWDLVFTEK